MSTVHDQPEAPRPAHPGSQSPLPGAGFPAGPGFPPGAGPWYGYTTPPPPPRRSHRLLTGAVAAVVAFAAGAGVTAWAAGGSGTSTSGQLSTSAIVKKTDPAVVDIVSNLGDQGEEAAGTGIVMTSTGEILTNNHVIDGATAIRVTDIGNAKTYTAKVVGYDVSKDVAVLQLKDASGLTTANIGDSGDVSVGHKVVAIGNAGGKGGLPSVVTGRVTGLNEKITATDAGSGSSERLTGMLRTNAKIQPGDSGGPLLDTSGEVVGIDTAARTSSSAASQLGTQQTAVQAFAIPINRATDIASQITKGESSSTVHIGATAFIGVQVSGQSTSRGATIVGVVPGDAAAKAGLAGGDTIVSLGGKAVTSSTGLRDNLVTQHPGEKTSITWQDQSGQSHSATITLGSGPAA